MKHKNRFVSILMLAVCTIAIAVIAACGTPQTHQDISVQQAHQLIEDNQSNSNFVILDIRAPSEYADGYIAGALNINFYDTDFADQIDALDKSKTYLVYCRSANRSGQAMPTFNDLGFTDVYDMQGGIVAWLNAGYDVLE
jgi:rhodanese-related sulfurtransferase